MASSWLSRIESTEDKARREVLLKLIDHNGGEPIRCGKRIDTSRTKGPMDWRYFPGEIGVSDVHYRSVLRSQVVFDIGDDRLDKGYRQAIPWERVVVESHALWDALSLLGIDHWRCLSGGKGTHAEVFGPPCSPDEAPPQHRVVADTVFEVEGDWRKPLASAALTVANNLLRERGFGGRVRADTGTISPNPGNHMLRDFGQRKAYYSERAKLIWPHDQRLPDTIEEAYSIAKAAGGIPTSVPSNPDLAERFGWRPVGCPKSQECHDPRSNSGWPGCGSCPFWN